MTSDTVSPDLLARAARIKLVCFDVDGTLTDGRLIYDDAGVESKAFHVRDGMGLRLLEDAGIPVALITARSSAAAMRRAGELRLSHIFTAVADKAACLRTLAGELGIALDDVAYMGDDLPDLPALRIAGLAAVPADAHDWVAGHAHLRTLAAAGRGAARELSDLILQARGEKAGILARFGA